MLCFKGTSDMVFERLCRRCYRYHRLIAAVTSIMLSCILSVCPCPRRLPCTCCKKSRINTRNDGFDILRVFPTSLSIPLRRVLDSAVALVLL